MDKPKHDKTPTDEVEEALRENVRLGYVVEGPPGHFSLTPAGVAHTKSLLESSQPARDFLASAKGLKGKPNG